MATLIAGLCLFFAAHGFTMFRAARARLIAQLGALPYRGLHALVSLAGFVLIIVGFGAAPRLELWAPPLWLRPLAMVLMLPVFVLLIAAYLPGRIKAHLGNPMLIALKTWAFAHLLVNGDAASLLLFGAFLAYGVIDLVAVRRSGRSAVVAHPRVVFDLVAIVAGLALYAAVVTHLHRYLAGVPLLAG